VFIVEIDAGTIVVKDFKYDIIVKLGILNPIIFKEVDMHSKIMSKTSQLR